MQSQSFTPPIRQIVSPKPIWARVCASCGYENSTFGQETCSSCLSPTLPECSLLLLLQVCWTCIQCYGLNLRYNEQCTHCGCLASETFTSTNSNEKRPAALIRQISGTNASLKLFTTDIIPQAVHAMARMNSFAFSAADVLSLECAILIPPCRIRSEIVSAMVHEMRPSLLRYELMSGHWNVVRTIIYARLNSLQADLMNINTGTAPLGMVSSFAPGLLQDILQHTAAEGFRQQIASNFNDIIQTLLQETMNVIPMPDGFTSEVLNRSSASVTDMFQVRGVLGTRRSRNSSVFLFSVPLNMNEEDILSQLFESAEPEPFQGLSDDQQDVAVSVKLVEDASGNCAVCLCDLKDNGDDETREVVVEINKCKHEFHQDCLKPWLNEHNTCPVCRSKLDE